jgi:hypothetical protein
MRHLVSPLSINNKIRMVGCQGKLSKNDKLFEELECDSGTFFRRDTAAFELYSQEHGCCLGIAVEELRTDKALTRSEVVKRANVSVLCPGGAS